MFSLFGFGKRRPLVRKRNPKVYKKNNKFIIKNGKKVLKLPASSVSQAVKLLINNNIYTKARRAPYSKKRAALVTQAPQNYRSMIDSTIQLKLLEFLNKPPQVQPSSIQVNTVKPDTPPNNSGLPPPPSFSPAATHTTEDVINVLSKDQRNEVDRILADTTIPMTARRENAREYLASVSDTIAKQSALLGSSTGGTTDQKDEYYSSPNNSDLKSLPLPPRVADLTGAAASAADEYLSPTNTELTVGTDSEDYINEREQRQYIREIKRNQQQQTEALAAGNIPAFINETAQIEAQLADLESELDLKNELDPETPKRGELKGQGEPDVKPQSAGTTEQGLYDSQIESIMKPEPRFLKVIARDEILSLIPLAKHATDAYGSFGFIMNLDSRAQSSKQHWVAVYCDPIDRKEICFYDPFGEPPPYEKVSADIKKLVAALDLPYSIKYKINMIPNQDISSNRCGIHAMLFLDKMFSGIPFSEATNYSVYKSELNAKNTEEQLKKFGLV